MYYTPQLITIPPIPTVILLKPAVHKTVQRNVKLEKRVFFGSPKKKKKKTWLDLEGWWKYLNQVFYFIRHIACNQN